MDTKDQKTYEIGYLLSPFIPAEQLEEAVAKMFKTNIEAKKGVVTTTVAPKMRPLAYAVAKMVDNKKSVYRDAYFGAVRFEAIPSDITAIKEAFDKDANVVRFLIIVAPKGSEIVTPKRVMTPRRTTTRASAESITSTEDKPAVVVMSKEDIDKEIEGLISEAV